VIALHKVRGLNHGPDVKNPEREVVLKIIGRLDRENLAELNS